MAEISIQSPNLAIVGMHGPPEATGPALAESARQSPIAGWDIENAYQEPIDRRYLLHNMAFCFPGDQANEGYELRRPAQLLQLAAGRNVVIDVHDNPTKTGEFVEIGEKSDARFLALVALLGMKDVVLSHTKGNIVNNNPRTLSVELCRGDINGAPQMLTENVERLRYCMEAVATDELPSVSPEAFNYYERILEIHSSHAEALGLQRKCKILPFEPIPSDVIELLGLPEGDYVAEYWNGISSSNGQWFGGVFLKKSCLFKPEAIGNSNS